MKRLTLLLIVLGLVPSYPIFGANGSSTCLHQWAPHSKIFQKGFITQKIPGFSCQFCAKFLTSLPIQSIQKKSLTEEILEKAIRKHLWKPIGTLTTADFASVKWLVLSHNNLTDVEDLGNLTQLKVLFLNHNKLIDVTGLEKCTKLEWLRLDGNPDLTKAKIDQLQMALPWWCKIISNPTK